jgi:hypothetical protein
MYGLQTAAAARASMGNWEAGDSLNGVSGSGRSSCCCWGWCAVVLATCTATPTIEPPRTVTRRGSVCSRNIASITPHYGVVNVVAVKTGNNGTTALLRFFAGGSDAK